MREVYRSVGKRGERYSLGRIFVFRKTLGIVGWKMRVDDSNL